MKILIVNGIFDLKYDENNLNGLTRPMKQLRDALAEKYTVKLLSYNGSNMQECKHVYTSEIKNYSPDAIINFENSLTDILFDTNVKLFRYIHAVPQLNKLPKGPHQIPWEEKMAKDKDSYLVFCSNAQLKSTERNFFKLNREKFICFPSSPTIDLKTYSHKEILNHNGNMITFCRADKMKKPFLGNELFSNSICFIPEKTDYYEKNKIGKIYIGYKHEMIMSELRKSKFSIIHKAPYDALPGTILESGVRGIPILSTDIIDEFNPIYEVYPEWAYFSKDCNFTLNDRIKLSEVVREKYSQNNFLNQWLKILKI